MQWCAKKYVLVQLSISVSCINPVEGGDIIHTYPEITV